MLNTNQMKQQVFNNDPKKILRLVENPMKYHLAWWLFDPKSGHANSSYWGSSLTFGFLRRDGMAPTGTPTSLITVSGEEVSHMSGQYLSVSVCPTNQDIMDQKGKYDFTELGLQ